jgi:Domain of unknown function (DUF4394)
MTMTMNKKLAVLTFIMLAFAISSASGLMGNHSASAETKVNSSTATVPSTANLGAQFFYNGVQVYALGANNNTLYLLSGSTFNRVGAISPVNGTVAECDFRPLNNQLICVTDSSRIYTVNPANASATLVATLAPAINSGAELLLDFNPMADAIRYIGRNELNYAIVKDAAGNFNTVAVQTPVAFVAGDVNAGVNPNLVAGAYDNNLSGLATTTFFAWDSDRDRLVRIADRIANGSSNTAGGRLQTIGSLFDQNGLVNITPSAGFDISTFPQLGNLNVGWLITDGKITTFFSVQVPNALPLGQTQNLGGTSQAVTASDGNNRYADIMVTIPQR